MPIYEYECRFCGRRSDELRSIDKRDHHLSCPACEAGQLERRLAVRVAVKHPNKRCNAPPAHESAPADASRAADPPAAIRLRGGTATIRGARFHDFGPGVIGIKAHRGARATIQHVKMEGLETAFDFEGADIDLSDYDIG